jgi:hypothetical protein
MSQGNLGAAIGLANTNKIPQIGDYVQGHTPPPGWCAQDSYMGVNGSVYYNRNVVDEDYTVGGGLVVNGNSGAAAGKAARWVSNTAQLTVSADQTIAVSAGGVATAGTAQAYKTALPVGMVLPANSFFWVFLV